MRLHLSRALFLAALCAAGTLWADAPALLERVTPYADIAGGMEGEVFQPASGQYQANRASTQMISRFGMRADLNDWVYVESELEADLGLHGSSAWEGQAALEVRNQLIRLHRPGWRIDVGRITDDASVDYFSAHVADMLIADTFTRDPLLYSGFNRGNGVLGTYEVAGHFRFGLALNAGNPLATTATLVAGGPFPPFARYYLQPYQSVGLTPNHYPDDSFQLMEASPSLVYFSDHLEIKTELQLYYVDVNTTANDGSPITGGNFRLNACFKMGPLRMFANAAYNINTMLDPSNLKVGIPDQYHSLLVSGGTDYNFSERFGIGVQYAHVNYQPGSGSVVSLSWANFGLTYWVSERIALGARVAGSFNRQNLPGGPLTQGEEAAFLTLRTAM
jgi:hypothetical protein